MVHALEHTKIFLQPGGQLINVHDLPVPHVIEVHSAETIIKAGWLMDSDDFNNERYATDAIAQVVSEGNYLLEDERDFIYYIYADDVDELQQWLDEWWETAVLADRTIQRVEEILRELGQTANVVLRVPTRMTKLLAA